MGLKPMNRPDSMPGGGLLYADASAFQAGAGRMAGSAAFVNELEGAVELLQQSGGYEDLAGLKPLPINRMLRQAGRPAQRQWSRNESMRGYGGKPAPLGPGTSAEIIRRNQRVKEVVNDWNPLEAEAKQRLNNTNPAPRSKPSAPGVRPVIDFWGDLQRTAERRRTQAFTNSAQKDPGWSSTGSQFKKFHGDLRSTENATDPSLFLTDQERGAAKSMILDYLDSVAGKKSKLEKSDLPWGVRQSMPKFGNDMLYEWNARRARIQQENTVDMVDWSREAIRPIETYTAPSNRRPAI